MTEQNGTTLPSCLICKLKFERDLKSEFDYSERLTLNCPRCHKFTITRTAARRAEALELGQKLSAWIRNLNENGIEVPEINSNSLEQIQKILPDHSPREKQIILLQNIERMTKYPGKPILIIPEYDIPLAWASDKEEFMYYIESLINRGFLRNIGDGQQVYRNKIGKLIYDSSGCLIEITANGWEYLEQLEKHIEASTQAFVAMSFSEELKPIWEGPIFNAIKKAGYKPYRVDAEPHSDRIDVKIIAEIKNSRFLVADITEQKRGVYFEAGYALGLGLPVIWCVRKDDLDKVHFDTRQYNHIVWEAPEDLENELFDFICAIIGKGKGS